MPVSEFLTRVELDVPFDRTKCRPVLQTGPVGCYLRGRLGVSALKADVSIYFDSDASDLLGTIILKMARPGLQVTVDDYSAVVGEWNSAWQVRTFTTLVFARRSGNEMPEGCGLTATVAGSRGESTVSVDCIGWADNGEPPRLDVVLTRRP